MAKQKIKYTKKTTIKTRKKKKATRCPSCGKFK